MTRILVVDNYDSFVYTIVGYLDQLGAQTVVVRNDAVPPLAERTEYDGVLISPGPGTPRAAGQSMDVIADCAATGLPMLGVCLGHQALAEVFGATVTHAPELMHGKTSQVTHDGAGVLAGLPSPFTATRYHSLAVVESTVPDELVITARTLNSDGTGVIMALQHRDLPLHGVQFHPESVLTQGGHHLLATWLEVCGLAGAVEASRGMAPLVREVAHA
ncbi:MAG: aminodeoxychorismate/anthranilate synthase component II [Cellulomonadaceae bacterium]|nr:aminodeoxychorismate/anthranilate synthase component II [Cellulomonadaceae bacterium]